jgi:hypothetical protein
MYRKLQTRGEVNARIVDIMFLAVDYRPNSIFSHTRDVLYTVEPFPKYGICMEGIMMPTGLKDRCGEWNPCLREFWYILSRGGWRRHDFIQLSERL